MEKNGKGYLVQVRLLLRPAILIGTAAVLCASIACDSGGSGGNESPPPTSSGDVSATASPTGGETPGPIDAVNDLAVDSPLMAVFGRQTDDLLTGATNVALGDFNDDGQPDLLVGAANADGPEGQRPDAGEAYVFFGPLQGEHDLLSKDADITIYGASGDSSGGDNLGFSVFAGDLDDDGVDDVMVGAPGVTAGFDPRTDQGRLYIFYGGAAFDRGTYDLAEDAYDLTVTGSEGFSRLSSDVDLGDINGDGRTDLLVSSPFAGRAPGTPPGSARTAEGEVYVIFGVGERLTGELNMAADDYDVLLGGNQEFGQFGAAFAVGDFNGDEFDDVVAGAYRNNAPDGRPSAGGAYVFLGSDDVGGRISVLEGAQDMTIVGALAGSAFGLPAVAGDFNGDGFDDFAIGAQSEGIEDLSSSGGIRIFYGANDLPSEIDLSTGGADVLLPGSTEGLLLPSALAAGDANGDGRDDLVFSSTLGGSTLGRNSAGLIYLLAGSSELSSRVDIGSDVPEPIIGPAAGARAGGALWFGAITNGGAAGLAVLAAGVSPNAERPNAGAVYVVPLEAR